MKSRESIPELAPPGAGLPFPELWIARWIFRRRSQRASVSESAAALSTARTRILQMAGGCDRQQASDRVLIPRLRGLEDSSRFWSICMTLEHLRIVNEAVAGTIGLLREGRKPGRVASTADVKPAPDVKLDLVPGFEQSCAAVERSVAGGGDLRTAARYEHPWFGPLNAAEWHTMAGFHMELHLRQMEEILRRLQAGDRRRD